ncbi:MAG: hypothetical protein JRJ60_20890 [Deltaproteobacteria bacterium]|nr:hypothetical protein [Deltaproteobacteria bacterium]
MDRNLLISLGELSAYFQHLNTAFEDCGEGWALIRMDVRPHHINMNGVVHGAAVAVARCTIMISGVVNP